MNLPSSLPSGLSAEQIVALESDLATFPPQSQRRGREYVVSGRVGTVRWKSDGFDAAVAGREVYETAWFWSDALWESDCTCPAGPYCKHAYALGMVALARLEGHLGHGRGAHRPTGSGLAFLPQPPADRGRRLPIRVIDRLRAATDYWDRQQHFRSLLQAARNRGFNVFGAEIDSILREDDPDLLCWRLANALDHLPPEVYPDALLPYRSRPDLQERYADRERIQVSAALLEWSTRQRQLPERRLRLVLGILTGADRQPRVTVEARLSTPRLNDEPRTSTQLQQLRNDLRRSPESFDAETASLIDWVTQRVSDLGGGLYYPGGDTAHQRLGGSQLRSLLSRFSGSPLVTWGDDLDARLAVRAGVEPGLPLHAGLQPVRILPTCRSHDGELFVELACVWENGHERPLAEVVLLRGDRSYHPEPSLVIADGSFHAIQQEPPALLLDRFTELGRVPVRADERDAVLGTLTNAFPHLQRSVVSHTRHHSLQPVVAMDLRDDDWLQIRLYARSRSTWAPSQEVTEDDVVFEYTPAGRWTRLRAKPSPSAAAEELEDIRAPEAPADDASETPPIDAAETPAEVWFEAPHPDLVAPAHGWMTSLDLHPGTKGRPGARAPGWKDAHIGWWMRLTRKTAALFAESWEHRPLVIAFFGTPRVRRMLSGEMRVWPKLKIESSGIDWFSVSAEWEAEGMRFTDEDLAALRNSNARFVKISSGWVQRDIADVHDSAANVLADLGIEAGAGTQRLSMWQLVGAQPESLKELEKFGADPQTLAAVQRLRERVARFKGLPVVKRPPSLAGDLRPYQQRGLDFLAYTSALGVGAVLADDMGLGKTLQALAWLLHLRREDPQGGPCLVVCPASVVHNWEREAQHFAPKLRVLLLTSGKTRHELRREIPEHDLVVTNYALLRRDVDAWRDAKLRAVIFDEAQQIKNPDAAVTRAAAAVQAPRRLALTGTPLENRALDLFSIVDVVNPGYLGRRSRFQQRFDKPEAPLQVRTLLAAKLRPILLRRTKKEVAPELPDRIEEQWDCEMTPEQRQLYLAEVKQSRAMIERLTGTRGGITQNKIHILAALTRLRQICCHPKLAGGHLDAGSGKFEAFLELIDPILAEGHKVLVFSQFVECIRLLRAALKARDIEHHVLTGQSTKRAAIIDAFQDSPNPGVFLISLKAGGTGLNLTAASYVVLFDPWWNPAVEAQAIDRTHRIGQDRTVIAYRLITRGTIEEKIFQLQQRKAALAKDILGEDGFARALTRADLDYLLEET